MCCFWIHAIVSMFFLILILVMVCVSPRCVMCDVERERTEERRCAFELERVDGWHSAVGPNSNVPQSLQDVGRSQWVPRGEEE